MVFRWLVLPATVLLANACSPAAQDCPNVPELSQSECSAQTLTYTADIAPILNTRCTPCHAAGGQEASLPLTSHSQVFAQRIGIGTQLASCSMPPAGSPQPSTAERKQVLDWLSCGAPP